MVCIYQIWYLHCVSKAWRKAFGSSLQISQVFLLTRAHYVEMDLNKKLSFKVKITKASKAYKFKISVLSYL